MIRAPPAWGRIPASRCKRLASRRRWQRSADPASTTIILVARPEISAIAEAARTSAELRRARCLEPASGRERRVLGQRPIRRDGCVAGRPGQAGALGSAGGAPGAPARRYSATTFRHAGARRLALAAWPCPGNRRTWRRPLPPYRSPATFPPWIG